MNRASDVQSPCISVCRIDPANGLCEGCLRTLDEIARWGTMNDEARRSVWNAIDARRERRVAGEKEQLRDRHEERARAHTDAPLGQPSAHS